MFRKVAKEINKRHEPIIAGHAYKLCNLKGHKSFDIVFSSLEEAKHHVSQYNHKQLANNKLGNIDTEDFYKTVPCEIIDLTRDFYEPNESFYWTNMNIHNIGNGNNFNPSYVFSFDDLIDSNEPILLPYTIGQNIKVIFDKYPEIIVLAISKDILKLTIKEIIREFLYQYSQHMNLKLVGLVDLDSLDNPMKSFLKDLNDNKISLSSDI